MNLKKEVAVEINKHLIHKIALHKAKKMGESFALKGKVSEVRKQFIELDREGNNG